MSDRFFSTPRSLRGCLIALLSLSLLPAVAQDTPAQEQVAPAKPTPPRKINRVYLADLEGTWITRDYLERVRASRAPHATARGATGVAIKIQREGRSWPIVITNFQETVPEFIIDVQPDKTPRSYRLVLAKEDRPGISSADVTYLYFRGERSDDGVFRTLSIAEPNFARKRYLTYLRLEDPLDAFINRAVIAGRYQAADGDIYEFTEAGTAILPDREFAYEISLDPSTAKCEMIQSHREQDPQGQERIGFAWKGAHLELYNVNGKKTPYRCAAKPFAVLKRL